MMRISSEQIKSILIEQGFEDKGHALVKPGNTEFVATVVANRIELSFSGGPITGSYAFDVFSHDFPALMEHLYADARSKTRAGARAWRL